MTYTNDTREINGLRANIYNDFRQLDDKRVDHM